MSADGSVSAVVSKRGSRRFIDKAVLSVDQRENVQWKYPGEDSKARFREYLISKLRLCFPSSTTWTERRGSIEKPVWREELFVQEVVNGYPVVQNTASFFVDYQTGSILGASRRGFYKTTGEARMNKDADLLQKVRELDGPFDDASIKTSWTTIGPFERDEKSIGEPRQPLVLLDAVGVRRGETAWVYYFDQTGKRSPEAEFWLQMIAPHVKPPASVKPPEFVKPPGS